MYNMVSCIPRMLIVIEISSPLSWTERVREKVMGRSTGIEQERHSFVCGKIGVGVSVLLLPALQIGQCI